MIKTNHKIHKILSNKKFKIFKQIISLIFKSCNKYNYLTKNKKKKKKKNKLKNNKNHNNHLEDKVQQKIHYKKYLLIDKVHQIVKNKSNY